MKRDIPIAQVMPGDVLLYRIKGLISDAIRFIDRSEVSHASLFLGRYSGMGRTVGEAIREGVIRRTLPKSIEHVEWVESRRLKEPPASLDPVLDRADYYLKRGEHYAFEQILLLAFLCITRNLSGSRALGWLIRETLDAAAAFLLRLFNAGKEPMICSELIVRCYGEAFPGLIDVPVRSPGVLRFGERGVPIGKNGGIHRGSALSLLLEKNGSELSEGQVDLEEVLRTAGMVDVAVVEQRIETYFNDLQEQAPKTARIDLMVQDLQPSFERFAASLCLARRRPEREKLSRAAVLGELFDAAADFVTPGDLQRSKSLAFIGKLDKKGTRT
ncbi:MAG TPA: hypothetical protein VFG28_07245 [Syntrophales bacterium]|nr:hypothetical protein [Syntrophales bacterium]